MGLRSAGDTLPVSALGTFPAHRCPAFGSRAATVLFRWLLLTGVAREVLAAHDAEKLRR